MPEVCRLLACCFGERDDENEDHSGNSSNNLLGPSGNHNASYDGLRPPHRPRTPTQEEINAIVSMPKKRCGNANVMQFRADDMDLIFPFSSDDGSSGSDWAESVRNAFRQVEQGQSSALGVGNEAHQPSTGIAHVQPFFSMEMHRIASLSPVSIHPSKPYYSSAWQETNKKKQPVGSETADDERQRNDLADFGVDSEISEIDDSIGMDAGEEKVEDQEGEGEEKGVPSYTPSIDSSYSEASFQSEEFEETITDLLKRAGDSKYVRCHFTVSSRSLPTFHPHRHLPLRALVLTSRRLLCQSSHGLGVTCYTGS